MAFRYFAFLVPVIFSSTYLLTLMLMTGITWNIHIWGGAIIFSGIGGLIASHGIQPVHPRHQTRPVDGRDE